MPSLSKVMMLLILMVITTTFISYHEYALATKTMDIIDRFQEIYKNNNHTTDTTNQLAALPKTIPTKIPTHPSIKTATHAPKLTNVQTLKNISTELSTTFITNSAMTPTNKLADILNDNTVIVNNPSNDKMIYILGACYCSFNQLERALKILGYTNYQRIPLSTDLSELDWRLESSLFILLDGESKTNNTNTKYQSYKKYKYEKIINYFEILCDYKLLYTLNIDHHEDDVRKWTKLSDILNVSIPNVSFPAIAVDEEKCYDIDLKDLKLFLNLSSDNMSKYESFVFNIGDTVQLFDDIYFVEKLLSHGRNGAIFIFKNVGDDKKYVVKRSMYKNNCRHLRQEYDRLKLFQNGEKTFAVPEVYGYASFDNMCVLQMQLIVNSSMILNLFLDLHDKNTYGNSTIKDMIQIWMQNIVKCYDDVSNALSVLHKNNLYLTDFHRENVLYKIIDSNKWQCYLIDFGDAFDLNKNNYHSDPHCYHGPVEYYSCYAFYNLMIHSQRKYHNFIDLNRYALMDDNYNLATLIIDTFLDSLSSLTSENISSDMYHIYDAQRLFWEIQQMAWNEELIINRNSWKHLHEMEELWEMRMSVVKKMKQFFEINFQQHGFDTMFSHIENNYQCSKQKPYVSDGGDHSYKNSTLLSMMHIGQTGGSTVYSAIEISHTFLGSNWIALHDRKYKNVCTFRCRTGHYPPSCFDISETPYYNKSIQPIFTVVRNPYTRLLSHFDYYHSMNENKTKIKYPDYCHIEYFNKYISDTIDLYWNTKYGRGIRGCHIMPQYQFVYYFDDFTSYRDIKIAEMNKELSPFITDIIKFETLQHDLDGLMDKYKLERVNLPGTNVHKAYLPSHKTCVQGGLSIYNLTTDNLRKVNALYKADFNNFGYDMIET